MFCRVLTADLELSRQLLELILNKEIKRVELADAQHEVSITSDIKSVRFDVYLNDDEGTVFDLEMQTSSRRVLPKRSRYYQSLQLGDGTYKVFVNAMSEVDHLSDDMKAFLKYLRGQKPSSDLTRYIGVVNGDGSR